MGDNIKVYVEGFGGVNIKKGSKLEELSKKVYGEDYKKYLSARVDNEIVYLGREVEEGKYIKFLDIKDKDGHRIYTRTISAIFIKACKDLFPKCNVTIEHSLGEGLYAEIDKKESINFTQIELIKSRMNEIIEKDITIEREKKSKDEAIEKFKQYGYDDKIRLLKHIEKETIHIYKIEDHIDRFHGYLAPSTGYANIFDLKYYYPGVIILFPTEESDYTVPKFKEQPKLAKVFKEVEDWANILDLGYLGSLNDKIEDNSIAEVIRVSEALHEKKIAQIADMICEDKNLNIILVAGPSSSGKTTFAQRLAVQLKVNGKMPISISVDDYFVNREDTPKNEYGEYDFEALEAIDLKLLNEDLIRLLEGEEVELPKFNFKVGKREMSGKKICVDEEHPIIVEGIHALNSKMTASIPEKNKFKIYISALTQLNIDGHNRIPTTDTRIIRRMVRDVEHRGNSIMRTFELWDGVRRGEEKNIFPYQEEADIMFDSALVYELGVLKKYIIPLLKEVDRDSIYFSEAKRLIKFLGYFKDIEKENFIPPNSILREFIGGSCFDVH
ncbi:MAG TPA: nucleoside kinase [Tissierellales bacterium]|nr:nucleoside kinase [Tissierellales bacterium]